MYKHNLKKLVFKKERKGGQEILNNWRHFYKVRRQFLFAFFLTLNHDFGYFMIKSEPNFIFSPFFKIGLHSLIVLAVQELTL